MNGSFWPTKPVCELLYQLAYGYASCGGGFATKFPAGASALDGSCAYTHVDPLSHGYLRWKHSSSRPVIVSVSLTFFVASYPSCKFVVMRDGSRRNTSACSQRCRPSRRYR